MQKLFHIYGSEWMEQAKQPGSKGTNDRRLYEKVYYINWLVREMVSSKQELSYVLKTSYILTPH